MRLMVIAVLWILTFLVRGRLFWLLLAIAAISTYFAVKRWAYLNGSPWRRVYFPLAERYERLSRTHSVTADVSQAPSSIRTPLGALVKEIQHEFSDAEIKNLLDEWEASFERNSNEQLFEEIWQESDYSPEEISRRLRQTREQMRGSANYNRYFVRHSLGEIIESRLGPEQKKAYWRAQLSGEVE